jgi:hypothetical protein
MNKARHPSSKSPQKRPKKPQPLTLSNTSLIANNDDLPNLPLPTNLILEEIAIEPPARRPPNLTRRSHHEHTYDDKKVSPVQRNPHLQIDQKYMYIYILHPIPLHQPFDSAHIKNK